MTLAASALRNLPAPAKVNLFLHVTGKRADGYHTLETVFQLIDLCDYLDIELRQDGNIVRTSQHDGVPEQTDLCVRAALLLQQHAGRNLGANIHLTKNIPMGGGLGGLLGGLGALGGPGMSPPSADAFLRGGSTPDQDRLRREILRIVVPLVAAVDYLGSTVGARLLGDNRQVVEALRRRRLGREQGTRLAEHFLGVGIDQTGLDSGRSFVGGVLQRAGHDGLLAMFAEAGRFPTDAELAAPGLWLARIGLAD